MGNDLQYIGVDKKLMNRTLIGKGLVPSINRCNYLKLRHFYTANEIEIISTERNSSQNKRKHVPVLFSVKGLVFRIKKKKT